MYQKFVPGIFLKVCTWNISAKMNRELCDSHSKQIECICLYFNKFQRFLTLISENFYLEFVHVMMPKKFTSKITTKNMRKT